MFNYKNRDPSSSLSFFSMVLFLCPCYTAAKNLVFSFCMFGVSLNKDALTAGTQSVCDGYSCDKT